MPPLYNYLRDYNVIICRACEVADHVDFPPLPPSSKPIPQLPIHHVWCCFTCGTYLSSSTQQVREHHHWDHPRVRPPLPWQVSAQWWFANSHYRHYWIVGVPSAQPQDPLPMQPTSAVTTPSLSRTTQPIPAPTKPLTEPSALQPANKAPASSNSQSGEPLTAHTSPLTQERPAAPPMPYQEAEDLITSSSPKGAESSPWGPPATITSGTPRPSTPLMIGLITTFPMSTSLEWVQITLTQEHQILQAEQRQLQPLVACPEGSTELATADNSIFIHYIQR
ncbi:hypothetical protein IFM51744_10187 [Aspergillus udagawae]|nr:hypothetical protein IFM51744_10187 [Aspergillus udagawae]